MRVLPFDGRVDLPGLVRRSGLPPAAPPESVPAGNEQASGWRNAGAAARRHPAVALLVLGLVAGGGFERWWVTTRPIGALTSDGAVIGLMATQLLHHGQVGSYMWGQAYGGSVEAVLTAAVFRLAGIGYAQLVATTAFSSALAALALWRTGRRVVGDRAAAIGALLLWVWPASFTFRSVKPGGTYMLGLAISLCAVGALVRLVDGTAIGRRAAALAGFWCGLAVWASPMSLQLLIPAALWCGAALWRPRGRWVWLAAGAVAGASPALAFLVQHGPANLGVPAGGSPGLLAGIPGRLAQFFSVEVPLATSLRVEGSLRWVGGWLGPVALVVVGAGFVAVLVTITRGRARRCRLPVNTLALLPILFAANTMANQVGQARYVFFGATMGYLLAGVLCENVGLLLSRRPGARPDRSSTVAWPVPVVAAGALGLLALAGAPAALSGLPAPDTPMSADDRGLAVLLSEHGITDAYANYWIGYRVMFETGQATVVAPFRRDRYIAIQSEVAASSSPAYLFLSASRSLSSFTGWCKAQGLEIRVWQQGGFAVVQPARKLLPWEVPPQLLA